ncbi:hypothetical protein BJV78DRAFT_1157108 [Lactifluus subvellereus]|nr:hypothetical protein BJV78DRAFT_1157108 [Lactifluus subvellereus]
MTRAQRWGLVREEWWWDVFVNTPLRRIAILALPRATGQVQVHLASAVVAAGTWPTACTKPGILPVAIGNLTASGRRRSNNQSASPPPPNPPNRESAELQLTERPIRAVLGYSSRWSSSTRTEGASLPLVDDGKKTRLLAIEDAVTGVTVARGRGFGVYARHIGTVRLLERGATGDCSGKEGVSWALAVAQRQGNLSAEPSEAVRAGGLTGASNWKGLGRAQREGIRLVASRLVPGPCTGSESLCTSTSPSPPYQTTRLYAELLETGTKVIRKRDRLSWALLYMIMIRGHHESSCFG